MQSGVDIVEVSGFGLKPGQKIMQIQLQAIQSSFSIYKILFLSGLLLIMTCLGCETNKRTKVVNDQTPALPVAVPLERVVTDFKDYTGRTDAKQSVDIRARVTGYLTEMPFKEGSEVKKGDLLFEIEKRPYKAQFDQSESQITLNEASLKLAKSTYERDLAVAKAVQGGVTQQQLAQDEAAIQEAQARVNASKASTEVYKINLGYTQVVSPMDGQISRYYLTKGNLVNQDQTLLTTIVSLDPIYVYFDMDEPTLLQMRLAEKEGKIQLDSSTNQLPVFMALQGESGYPHHGYIDFINNQVNPNTGSISVRGVFDNPKLSEKNSTRLISPGMFARIRLPMGSPYKALLVIDRAIASDQGSKYVYVLNDKNEAEYRKITTGFLQEDGLRVISRGLNPGDRVIVGGLQMVRPNMPIRPEERTMQSMARPLTNDPATPSENKSPDKGVTPVKPAS